MRSGAFAVLARTDVPSNYEAPAHRKWGCRQRKPLGTVAGVRVPSFVGVLAPYALLPLVRGHIEDLGSRLVGPWPAAEARVLSVPGCVRHSGEPVSGYIAPMGMKGAVPRVAFAAAAVASATVYRRSHLSWGAAPAEVQGVMPGDDILRRSHFTATRAITIDADPEAVWPWLLQVGFHRAGFYSYDLLDNLGRPSAEHVLPEFQDVAVGDLAAPMASPPDKKNSFTVALLDSPHRLVWAKPDSTWSWLLTHKADGRTRLVTRLKARYDVNAFLPVTLILMEIGDFPMMRRMLLGIRDRAENNAIAPGQPHQTPPRQSAANSSPPDAPGTVDRARV